MKDARHLVSNGSTHLLIESIGYFTFSFGLVCVLDVYIKFATSTMFVTWLLSFKIVRMFRMMFDVVNHTFGETLYESFTLRTLQFFVKLR